MEETNKELKQNKGLTDSHNGDLILNESGTSIDIGHLKDNEIDERSNNIDKSSEEAKGERMDHGTTQIPYDISDNA